MASGVPSVGFAAFLLRLLESDIVCVDVSLDGASSEYEDIYVYRHTYCLASKRSKTEVKEKACPK